MNSVFCYGKLAKSVQKNNTITMGMATYYKDTSDTFPSLNNNFMLIFVNYRTVSEKFKDFFKNVITVQY